KLLELNPHNMLALKNKGKYLNNRGQYDLAIDCLTEVLETEPNNLSALLHRARAYKKRAEYNFLFSKDRSPYSFISELEGSHFIEFGPCCEDLNKALADLEQIFKKNPNAPDALFVQADIYKLLGKQDLALKSLEKFTKNPAAFLIRLAYACTILANISEDDFCKYIQKAFEFYQAVSQHAPHLLSLQIKTA